MKYRSWRNSMPRIISISSHWTGAEVLDTGRVARRSWQRCFCRLLGCALSAWMAATGGARRVSMPLLQDVHVLVVDDEADVRDVICEILEIYGATVSSARSGEEAIGLLAARAPDVIVSDRAMANGDGFWLLREVRNRGLLAMPVIAISGHFDKSEQERLLAAGFDYLLAKPLRFDDLARIIARSIGR